MNKYNLISETLKFDGTVRIDCDLQVSDAEKEESDFDRTTLLTITRKNHSEVRIKFDWCNYSTTDSIFVTFPILETDKIFFGARFFWGVLDLQNMRIDRQEICAQFWNFERHKDTIVVITELEALAINLDGATIDTVPIDPPFESKHCGDYIEFDSPVFGRQTLTLIE